MTPKQRSVLNLGYKMLSNSSDSNRVTEWDYRMWRQLLYSEGLDVLLEPLRDVVSIKEE